MPVDLESALAKAKVPAADAKRLKKLIAFVRTQAKLQPARVPTVAEGALYIAGVTAKPPRRNKHFKDLEEQLLPALHAGDELDDWDGRVFTVWATGGCGLMQLSTWLLDQVRKHPDVDVMQRFVELAADVDLNADDFRPVLASAAGKTSPRPRKRSAAQRDVAAGYAFDRYVEALVRGFLRDFRAPRVPIAELSIYVPQGRSLPELVLVRADDERQYGVCNPTTPALEAISADDDDAVLAAINDGLDDELSWADYTEVPAAILDYELVRAAHAIADQLGARKALGAKAKVGLLIDDEHFADPKAFARWAKAALRKLPKPAREALVAACYVDARASRWLAT